MSMSLSVLVVEDNEDEALILNRVLVTSGLTSSIRIVPDGEEAVKYLQGQEEYVNRVIFPVPDIILADLKMVGMGGMGVLKWLKSHPNFFVIPLIVLTGSELDADIQTAYSLGANAYMVKPAHFEDLHETVTGTLKYWALCKTPHPVPA
jgi:CheY-like chemotaxis protein